MAGCGGVGTARRAHGHARRWQHGAQLAMVHGCPPIALTLPCCDCAPAAEGEAALEEVPKDLSSARAGGLALGTVSRLLTTLGLLYEGGPGGKAAAGDYRLALQRGVRHKGGDKGGR